MLIRKRPRVLCSKPVGVQHTGGELEPQGDLLTHQFAQVGFVLPSDGEARSGFKLVGLQRNALVGQQMQIRIVEPLGFRPNSSHRSETGVFSTRCLFRMATFSSAV